MILFDVDETWSDLSPMAERFEEVGAPGHLVRTWFAGLLRDGFALMVPGLGLGPEAWEPTIDALVRTGMERADIKVSTLPGYGHPVGVGDPAHPRAVAHLLTETSMPEGRCAVVDDTGRGCCSVPWVPAVPRRYP